MKDKEYNRFKLTITSLHKKGFRLAQGMTEGFYDDAENETVYNVTLQMYKKGDHEDFISGVD